MRCPECGRLLFLASCLLFMPGLTIEIKCSRCGEIVVWPVLEATAEVKSG
ncbi:MAG: hypothetical protein GTO03_05260 [Planctomycetales bacterium]|nr:hypothetical protein [Planctomycetales bacterium]